MLWMVIWKFTLAELKVIADKLTVSLHDILKSILVQEEKEKTTEDSNLNVDSSGNGTATSPETTPTQEIDDNVAHPSIAHSQRVENLNAPTGD